MKKLIILLVFVWMNNIAKAITYTIPILPDSIRQNMDAIIWENSIEITINKDLSFTEKVHKVITILNQKGNDLSIYEGVESKEMSTKLIQGIIYDATGRPFKKIKKSDINTIGEYSQFISDFKADYYNPEIHKFPYTVEYEYETKYDYLLYLPAFEPFQQYNTFVVNSSYSIEFPENLDIRSYQQNNNWQQLTTTVGNRKKYSYSINYQKGIPEENMAPEFDKIEPKIIFAPNQISYYSYKNKFDDWTDFGRWILQLNNKRDSLPVEVKQKMLTIKLQFPDVKERAKAIYNWMQDNTRYYSIQLGLGGFQPMKTLDVNKNKYGDCKALSFFTQTLFREAGIDAYYTLVKAGKNKSIIKEMPANQFNHVIICMPLKNDTIWLECTDQKIPFGYLGNFTDDRDVLVINNHPCIAHTKIYSAKDNIKSINASVNINQDLQTTGTLNYLTQGLQYEKLYKLEYLSSKDVRDKAVYELLNVNNIKLDEYSIIKKDSCIPQKTLSTSFSLTNFVTKVGAKILLKPNIFSQYTSGFQYDSLRILPIEQDENKTELDSILIKFPATFIYKNNVQPITIDSKFGNYTTQIVYDNNNHSLLYTRKLIINKGIFPAADKKEYRDFIHSIISADNAKIILSQ